MYPAGPFSPDSDSFCIGTSIRGVRLRCLALTLCLFALTHPGWAQTPAAAELPSAPGVQVSKQFPEIGIVSGTIVDSDGDWVAGARITLTQESRPSEEDPAAQVMISAAGGSFSFAGVSPGAFKLTIVATGFVPRQVTGELLPNEGIQVPAIALIAGSATSIDVTASQSEIAEAQINQEEKQRILGFIPNFYISYIPNPVPLDPRQKFELAFKTLIDPVSLLLNGVVAGVQQANNTYSWGQGAQGYAKRYAAAYGTFLTGTVIGNAILPIVLKQDPRYFYKGVGSIRSRFLYAVANAVVCRGDNHHWQPNYSAILGGIAAGGISNLYYPAVNRSGAALTFEGAAIGTGFSAVANVFQEFLIHKLTPHIPQPAPVNP